ncbi:aminotransferase class IV [Salinibacterium sp. M195]|uniref:aminotransferase class IV n=1 Tax=Salinibacterium sp. M195 TaxID=2583374 RepID=UPI001C63B3AB|nr:aminotransferase class IV [Salinibacterium sp. M195]QYH34735.1 branched-chain amino acid transferase [Salinibacterium sp. M195]
MVREPSDSFAAGAAYIGGSIVPIGQAAIPILDLGFLHSDATYDVVHVWNGRFFRLDDHLDRFERGMTKLRMSLPIDRERIRELLHDCVRASGLDNAYVELICTRGMAAPGSRDPRDCVNQFYAFAVPFAWVANAEQRERGLSLHVSSVQRIAQESVDPTVKNYHWLDLVQGLYDAFDHGAETALLSDAAGNVVEGPGFNVFAVIAGALVTPKVGVLQGITRRTALEIGAEFESDLGLRVEERALSYEELLGASEVFVTSTAGGIMPVTLVDGRAIGAGIPGPVTQKFTARYWKMHEDIRYSEAIR